MQLAEAEAAEVVLDNEVVVATVLDDTEIEGVAAVLDAAETDEDDKLEVLDTTVGVEVDASGGYGNSLVNHAGGLYIGGPGGP